MFSFSEENCQKGYSLNETNQKSPESFLGLIMVDLMVLLLNEIKFLVWEFKAHLFILLDLKGV